MANPISEIPEQLEGDYHSEFRVGRWDPEKIMADRNKKRQIHKVLQQEKDALVNQWFMEGDDEGHKQNITSQQIIDLATQHDLTINEWAVMKMFYGHNFLTTNESMLEGVVELIEVAAIPPSLILQGIWPQISDFKKYKWSNSVKSTAYEHSKLPSWSDPERRIFPDNFLTHVVLPMTVVLIICVSLFWFAMYEHKYRASVFQGAYVHKKYDNSHYFFKAMAASQRRERYRLRNEKWEEKVDNQTKQQVTKYSEKMWTNPGDEAKQR